VVRVLWTEREDLALRSAISLKSPVLKEKNPARPAYWKALVLTAPIAAACCYALHGAYHRIPLVALIIVALLGALLAAQSIHARVVHDWQAERAIDRADRLP
jgi:energy-converting hydrogenase Eha subunit A